MKRDEVGHHERIANKRLHLASHELFVQPWGELHAVSEPRLYLACQGRCCFGATTTVSACASAPRMAG